MSKPPFYRRKVFSLTLGLIVTVACLWYAISLMLQDENAVPQLVYAFRNANYWTLPLIFLVLFAFYWLKAWRWRLLLSPVGRFKPTQDLLPPIMIGFAFNNLLPAHLGEFVRCYVFKRQQQMSMTLTLSSVILERVFDVIAILSFLGLGLLFIPGVDPAIRTGAYVIAILSALCVAGGLVYVLWTSQFVAIFESILKRMVFIPHGIIERICRMLESGAEGLASLKDVRLTIAILVLSLIKWGLNGSLVLISLWAFGIAVSPMVAMVVLGVVAFGVTVPSSPGYFGVIQLCFMLVLKWFVEDRASIFAASVYFHVSQWVPVTAIGLLYFARTGLSIRQVEEVEEQLEEHPEIDESAGESLNSTLRE
jgi:glycosyltransferase 2 family protein